MRTRFHMSYKITAYELLLIRLDGKHSLLQVRND